jgi:hypothetical protein
MALSIMGRAAEEDGDALVVGGIHAVNLLLVGREHGCDVIRDDRGYTGPSVFVAMEI